MKRSIFFLALAASVAFVGCNRNIDPVNPAPGKLVVEPLITRSLSLNFKDGNVIGLDVVKADGTAHATNAPLKYSGTAFSGDLMWYEGGGEACSLKAYYPYQAAGFPETFTVDLDQSKGTDASDFMTASENDVYPTAAPVLMKFKHKFAQLNIVVDNATGVELDGVTIKGVVPTALISETDGEVTATADPDADPADIKAEALVAGKSYCVVIVPQTFKSLGVAVAVKNGSVILSGVEGAELKAGYSYTLNVSVLPDQVRVSIGGDIQNWEDGGSLNGGSYEEPFEEYDDHFVYGGRSYDIVTLANGSIWMAEPLAFVPAGKTVSGDPAAGEIFYPYSSDGTNVTVLTDDASIKKFGYLYKYDALMGTRINEENFDKLEGSQGICPPGWHIPTRTEWFDLCGTSNASKYLGESGTQTKDNALLIDPVAGYSTVAMFNEAGFNFVLTGCIANNRYNALICDSSVCGVEEYLGSNRMAYIATSTCNSATQYFAAMTTFTSANNLGKVSLSFATLASAGVSVRCTKNLVK